MKLAKHYMKYQIDITILAMPTGLTLTCETSKTKVEICNLTIYFSIKMIVAPLFEQISLFLCAVKIRTVYISF